MSTVPPQAAPDQPAISRLAVPLLSLAAFGSGISLRVTDPMLPYLSSQFGIGVGNAAHVVTFFSLSYGFAQLFFGPFGDRYGKYFAVGVSAMMSAFACLLCALAPGFSALVAARMFAGISAAALLPLSMAWIGDVVPYHERQSVIARFLIGQVLGLSSGVLLGGFAADMDNWRLPFFLISGFFLVVAIALFNLNRRLPPIARQTTRADGHVFARMLAAFKFVLSRPWARVVLVSVFLEGAFLYGAFAFLATHVHQHYDMSLTRAGALAMVFGLGGMVFALSSTRLVKRLRESQLAIYGGSIVMLCYFLIAALPSWYWIPVACFFAGVGFYMVHTTLQLNATQMAPEHRGAAVSAFASCFFLGQSAGVALAGTVVSLAGTVVVIFGCGLGIGLVALMFSRKKASQSA